MCSNRISTVAQSLTKSFTCMSCILYLQIDALQLEYSNVSCTIPKQKYYMYFINYPPKCLSVRWACLSNGNGLAKQNGCNHNYLGVASL